MYNIMIAQSKRSNYGSLYQFMTTTTDGVTTPMGFEIKDALDAKIETMLNDDGYSKADFIVVEVIDYTIDATSYSDDEDDTTVDTDEETTEG